MAQQDDTTYEIWHRAEKSEAGRVCVDTIKRLSDQQRFRRELEKIRLGAYLGRQVTRLGADLYYTRKHAADETEHESSISFSEAVVDTAVAKIFAKQRPKGQVVTKGGDWKERNQAKLYSKFLEGLLFDNQGCYENTWELTQDAGTDGCIFSAGVVKVYPDKSLGKVVHERCFSFDMFCDPLDARSGNPRGLHHRYIYDKSQLIDRFPEHKSAIMASSLHEDDKELTSDNNYTAMCSVYESWRLGPNGRHLIAVDGCSGEALVDEVYERDYFPFAFYVWKRPRFGFFGIPLIDQCIEAQAQANDFLSCMLENAMANKGGWIDAPRNSGYEESDVESNLALKVLWREGGTPPGVTVQMPPLFNEQTRQMYEMYRGLCYELPGVSEMASQGRKEASIESGVAIRTVNDMQSERFLPQARRYESMLVTIAKLDIDAVQDLAEMLEEDGEGKTIESVIPSEGFLEKVDWEEIDLETDRFEVIVAPSSANEDTIAARKQMIQEFVEVGWITPEVAKEALSSPNPDIENLSKRASAQRRFLEKVIGKVATFDPDDDDSSLKEIWDMAGPFPLLNLPAGIMQMTDAWIELMTDDDRPREQTEFLLEWIKRADEMAKPPAPPPEAAPPGGGQPMMPPADMGMPPPMDGQPPMEGPPPMAMPPPVAA